MKTYLLVVGKTDMDYLKEGISLYENRLKHYLPFETITLPALKNTQGLSVQQQKEKEGELILAKISTSDKAILLDEGGREYDSMGFAAFMRQNLGSGVRHLFFIVGGPYGVSEAVKNRVNGKLALSRLTFSHQMVRLFFVEQLYRAMTIIRNEPYHHQ